MYVRVYTVYIPDIFGHLKKRDRLAAIEPVIPLAR